MSDPQPPAPDRQAAARQAREQFTKDAEAFAAGQIINDESALEALALLADLAPSDRVIDVACGPGIVATYLAKHAAHVVGVDLTPKMLDLARSRATNQGVGGRCLFVEGSMDDLDVEDERFDVAVSRYALHHAHDVGVVADELVRVVRPGGRLVVVDFGAPDDESVATAYDDAERLRDPSHVRNLTPDGIQSLFAERGCRLISATNYRLPMRVDKLLAASNGTDHAGFALALERSLNTHGLGVNAREVDGVIRFEYPIAGFAFERPRGGNQRIYSGPTR
jgi:SAM-dependent methyltransferase